MASTNTAEKRIVVITRESMFYAPEDGSPNLARTVSMTSPIPSTKSTSKTGSLVLEDTDGGSETLAEKKSVTNQALCLLGMCVLLLVALCLLLVYIRRDTPPLHSIVVAVVGGMLGYAIAHAQTIRS